MPKQTHVKGHYRKNSEGTTSWVKPHLRTINNKSIFDSPEEERH